MRISIKTVSINETDTDRNIINNKGKAGENSGLWLVNRNKILRVIS